MLSFRLVSYLSTLIILVSLGAIVFANNTKGRHNRAFVLFIVAISSWIVSLAFADNSTSLRVVNIASRCALPTGASILMMVVYVALVFTKKRLSKKDALWALPLVVFITTAPTSLAVQKVTIQPYGAGVQGGPVYSLFSVYALIYMITGIIILGRGIRSANGTAKYQLRFLAYGLSVSTVIALITNLLFVSLGYLGPAGYLIFAFCATYAMIRHRLFDVRILAARSIAFVMLLVTFSVLYATILTVASAYLTGTGYASARQTAISVATGLLLAFSFQPLRRFFARITDGFFFRDKYDAQALIDQITSILAAELLLGRLLQQSLHQICSDMKISYGRFIVMSDKKILEDVWQGSNARSDAVLKLMSDLDNVVIVTDEMEPSRLKSALEHARVRMVLPLITNEGVTGYLFLGNKLSGDIYSRQDIQVLEILRKELAIAISNGKSYLEISLFNETLQERVHTATQRLRTANKNLKALDKTKDDFISMASHQLGTPLTAITGYLSLIVDGDRSNLTDHQTEFISSALEASERMAVMSSDMLNVSRLNAGRFSILRQPTDLAAIAAQEVHQLMPSAERKGLKLVFEPPAGPLPVLSIDTNKTRQVIMNLIDNAIYYTERGSVTVTIHNTGKALELRVIDNGIGVPPKEQARLFTKFYRADNAKTARPDGTGLGLYLAKEVTEEQGGTIIFESTLGKGSTFGFALPLQSAS